MPSTLAIIPPAFAQRVRLDEEGTLTETLRAKTELRPLPLPEWLAGRSPYELVTIAALWALEPQRDTPSLAAAMLHEETIARLLASLTEAERMALVRVQERGGSIPAAVLERESGLLRPHAAYPNPRAFLLSLREPPSATERLFLLGVVQLLERGSERLYAIPPDLLPLLPLVAPYEAHIVPSLTTAPQEAVDADVALLEQRLLAVLVLARDGQLETVPAGGLTKASLVRLGRAWDVPGTLAGVTREEHWPYAQFVRCIAQAVGLLHAGIGSTLRATPAVLDWLRLPRTERLRALLDAWVESAWDELAALYHIRAQRPYSRDLPAARRALLELLEQLPTREWLELDAFIAEVKRVAPDYARPHGDYFRWGLQGPNRLPLGGFVNWERVEGAQIRAVLDHSLRWLGLIDSGIDNQRSASFRLNAYGAALLRGEPAPDEIPEEPLVVQPNFDVLVPAHASLYARFQLGRFAEQRGNDTADVYRLTRRSLLAAAERGVDVDEIAKFLEEQTGRPVPQNVSATFYEWAGRYGQLTLRRGFVLQAEDAALLEQARRDQRVRMPQAEQLSERAWLVREGDAAELAERLRKAGYGLAADQAEAGFSEHDLAVAVAAIEFYAGACDLLDLPCEASDALRRRVARMVRERALNRAYHTSATSLATLRAAIASDKPEG